MALKEFTEMKDLDDVFRDLDSGHLFTELDDYIGTYGPLTYGDLYDKYGDTPPEVIGPVIAALVEAGYVRVTQGASPEECDYVLESIETETEEVGHD
jgi:hypothetical protein